MSAHTPGPWHAGDRGIGWEVHQGLQCSEACCEAINDGFRETFTEADARLIAAAPELLEALKDMVRVRKEGMTAKNARTFGEDVETAYFASGGISATGRIVARAETAIAKAEGRS